MRCLLCGKESDNDSNICLKCQKDYEMSDEQINNFNSGNSDKGIDRYSVEKTKGNVAIVSAIFIPLFGFVLGIIYACTLEKKEKPAVAIVLSILVSIFNFCYGIPILLELLGK